MKIKYALLDTVNTLRTYRWTILQSVSIPSLIIVFTDWAVRNEVALLPLLLLSVIGLVANVYMAVAVHRCVILGSEFARTWGIGTWTSRETAFVGQSIAIGFITFAPFAIVATVLSSVFDYDLETLLAVLFCLASYFMARLSLVFPSIAVEKPIRIRESWRITSKHHSLVFVLVFLVPTLLFLPVQFLPQDPIMAFLGSVYYCFVLIFTVALLSKTYTLCIEGGHGGDDHPADGCSL